MTAVPALVEQNHSASSPSDSTLMQVISQAIATPNFDVEKLQKLLDLQQKWEANQARKSFADAMAQFQAKCPTILKSKKADRYSYAPLDEILRTIRPHLEACGLSVRFTTRTDGVIITAICTVAHRDGHSEVSEFAAPVDSDMRVNATQKMGSANSYAKRYALCNALNLVGSEYDDDGAASTKPVEAMATDEQKAQIQDCREAGLISEAQLKWLEKNPELTEKQAASLLAKIKAAQK